MPNTSNQTRTTLECDHCGGDAIAGDARGMFGDGDGTACMTCGFPGHVSVDVEHAGDDENDSGENGATWSCSYDEEDARCHDLTCVDCHPAPQPSGPDRSAASGSFAEIERLRAEVERLSKSEADWRDALHGVFNRICGAQNDRGRWVADIEAEVEKLRAALETVLALSTTPLDDKWKPRTELDWAVDIARGALANAEQRPRSISVAAATPPPEPSAPHGSPKPAELAAATEGSSPRTEASKPGTRRP